MIYSTHMKLNHSTVSLTVLAGFALAAVVVTFEKVQTFVAQGIKDSQNLRMSESTVCDPAKGQFPHFGGCSTIL